MRRLLADNFIWIAQEYESTVLSDESKTLYRINPIDKLSKLLAKIEDIKYEEGTELSSEEKEKIGNYISLIITLLENKKLLAATPSAIKNLLERDEMKNLSKELLMKKVRIGTNTPKSLWEKIVDCMQYSVIRTHVLPKFIKKIGIKACVYCNANYVITDCENKAYYELDHFYPKSRYPFLSISFFNLQPSCSSCNHSKGAEERKRYFNLWSSSPSVPLDVFRFSIEKERQIQYWINLRQEELKIDVGVVNEEDEEMLQNMKDDLGLEKIYAEHLDTAEEILWRKKIYDGEYKMYIIEALSELGITNEDINRFILGSYASANDIHKRPLSKLIQDIYNSIDISE